MLADNIAKLFPFTREVFNVSPIFNLDLSCYYKVQKHNPLQPTYQNANPPYDQFILQDVDGWMLYHVITKIKETKVLFLINVFGKSASSVSPIMMISFEYYKSAGNIVVIGAHGIQQTERISQKETNQIISFVINTTMYFCQILNCKNITYINHTADYKLQKKRTDKGKLPMFDYRTLVVNVPNNNTVNLYGKSTETKTESMRLHLCRGHFKTYTSEHPLLGKFTGTYWWQSQIRGNKKNGVIEKEYDVRQQSVMSN